MYALVLLYVLLAILWWKEKVGKVFIKTDVLCRSYWGIMGLTLLRLALALVLPPPCAFLSVPTLSQDKKAGASHGKMFESIYEFGLRPNL